MNYSIDTEKRSVTITQNDNTITIKSGEVLPFIEDIEKQIYYRADIINKLYDDIDAGIYDSDILKDEEYINRVLESYTNYRREHDSGGESNSVWHWEDCLKSAFADNDYMYYLNEKEDMELE